MKILGLALFGTLLATAPAAADWTRSGAVTGPRGQMGTVQGSVSCAGGSCERDVVRAGPRGVSTRTDTLTRTAPGSFRRDSAVTTPRGRMVTGEGAITRR